MEGERDKKEEREGNFTVAKYTWLPAHVYQRTDFRIAVEYRKCNQLYNQCISKILFFSPTLCHIKVSFGTTHMSRPRADVSAKPPRLLFGTYGKQCGKRGKVMQV